MKNIKRYSRPLPLRQLRVRCNTKNFNFETTADIKKTIDIINQERALKAIRFGVGIKKDGYNIFALGPHGIDKHGAVRKTLAKAQLSKHNEMYDWCYVYNFESPRQPILLKLPQNTGKKLSNQMRVLIKNLQVKIPAIFEGRAYKAELKKIQLRHENKKNKIATDLLREARKDNVSITVKKDEYEILPIYQNKIISEETFESLSKQKQNQYEIKIDKYLSKVEDLVDKISEIDEKANELIKQLSDNFTKDFIRNEIQFFLDSYKNQSDLINYFLNVEKDIITNIKEFLPGADKDKILLTSSSSDIYTPFSRYQINVIVNCKNIKCPIVYEPNPTYLNLTGRVEQVSEQSILLTNHMFIRSGALHRANGGYLLVDAHNLLKHPHAWEGLKQSLYQQKITISPLEQSLGLSSAISIEPEAMPLDVKVILFGDNATYQALYYADPDFKKLFKVIAEFDEELDRNNATEKKYTQLIARIIKDENLLPFHKNAVAAVIDFSAKITGDATKLSVHNWSIKDLLCEANYWASKANKKYVSITDVSKAEERKINRSDQLIQTIKKHIKDNQILLSTSGSKVGQVNALSVIQEGDFSFGQPIRVTCTSRMGDSGVVDIEREVELGGQLHTKGILILSGFLSGRYAKNHALSLAASIVMEQNYSTIDGDSASLAELCALLSSIADLPIKQSMAITGSVNQFGEVQSIGGVNEKIEGFFDVCKAKGFKANQGVIIPYSNAKHLMLKEEIIKKAKSNKFNIYAVSTVDEAIALLTGMEAGKPNKSGSYPKNTVNYLINAKLNLYAKLAKDEKD